MKGEVKRGGETTQLSLKEFYFGVEKRDKEPRSPCLETPSFVRFDVRLWRPI